MKVVDFLFFNWKQPALNIIEISLNHIANEFCRLPNPFPVSETPKSLSSKGMEAQLAVCWTKYTGKEEAISEMDTGKVGMVESFMIV